MLLMNIIPYPLYLIVITLCDSKYFLNNRFQTSCIYIYIEHKYKAALPACYAHLKTNIF